jgi:hypothetical protein
MGSLDRKITNIEAEIKKLATNKGDERPFSYAEIVSKLDKNANLFETRLTEQQTQIQAFTKQITKEISSDTRAKNVIIFGLKEPQKSSISDTVDSVSNLLKTCGLKHDKVDTSVARLGPKRENKIRPVRLILQSESEKKEFLRRINGQRLDGVFARLDLTKEEQSRDFLLRQELRERRKTNPEKRFRICNQEVVEILGSE